LAHGHAVRRVARGDAFEGPALVDEERRLGRRRARLEVVGPEGRKLRGLRGGRRRRRRRALGAGREQRRDRVEAVDVDAQREGAVRVDGNVGLALELNRRVRIVKGPVRPATVAVAGRSALFVCA